MIPNNIIFNPSLSIPQGAPINKLDTNPPFYDMSSLIQAMQQATPQPNPRIPINPPKINPPIQPPISPTEPIPVNPVDVQPAGSGLRPSDVQPTQPQPTEPIPYYPNPEPIKPKKPRKPVPIPDNPPLNVEPYPYNDVLGKDLVNLATSIGLGAVTGGASVAAESALAGAAEGFAANGLRGIAGSAARGVAASVPNMTRAGIAGGVATGLSHVLGGGQAGNIVAGIAGGLASRGRSGAVGGAIAGAMNNVSSRGSRPRIRAINRPDNMEHPLLPRRPFTGEANIAGGNNTGVSRLVTQDPATEETTQWRLPNEPVNNIMSNIRNVANRTMTSATETVSNLSNQISEAVRPRRARHAPLSDEIVAPYDREEAPPGSALDIPASMKLQAAIRRKTQDKTIGNMKWDNEMEQNEINRKAANKLTAALKRTKMQTEYKKPAAANTLTSALKRTKQQIEYEQDVIMDRENKAKSSKMSKDIINDIVNSSVDQSETRKKAASKIYGAIKRTFPAPKMIKEHYKKIDASTKLQAAAKGAIQRKQDRAVTNMANLTDQLKETVQYGNSQAVLNEYAAKRQNISNFGALARNLQQEQSNKRMGIASMKPVDIGSGTRSGAAFAATREQLNAPSRTQVHRLNNPELTQLRGQISDFKRGKLQLTDVQKAGIETRIAQLVEINKALRAKGQGPKLGRPGKK